MESKVENLHEVDNDNETNANNLSEMFDKALKMYNKISNTDKSTNSSEVQTTVKYLINTFETATRLVSLVGIFSTNETIEDVPTENVKYFLLPALLGSLTMKISDISNRMHIIDVAEVYFIDFLKRIKMYNLIDFNIPHISHENKNENSVECPKSNSEKVVELVNARTTKIQRYKNQKELEKKLETLKEALDNPEIDEEVKREYFITLIKMYANQALEELTSLAAERPILEHMKNNHDLETNKPTNYKKKEFSGKLQPIIITRDAVQKQVYGAGYPSLPVLTVEEFYEQRVKDGEWPEKPTTSKTVENLSTNQVDGKDQEDEENEKRIEMDDPEYLAKVRAMDEYKDVYRRGWGNRANRS